MFDPFACKFRVQPVDGLGWEVFTEDAGSFWETEGVELVDGLAWGMQVPSGRWRG